MSNAPASASTNIFTKGFIPGLIVGLLVGLAVGVFMPALIGPETVIKPNPNPHRRAGPSERDPGMEAPAPAPTSDPAAPAKPEDKPVATPPAATNDPKPG